MKLISEKITRSVGRTILKTKKNSPHFLFAGGVVGVVGTTVLACRATLKLEKAVDEIKGDIMSVKVSREIAEHEKENYTERDYYTDLTRVYGKSLYKVTKLYAPSVILGGVSIGMLTGSHMQLTRRNNALTMTLAAVSKAFDEYRIRVAEEIGHERELELYRNIHDEPVEAGSKKTVKVIDGDEWSIHARIFDTKNPNWTPNSEFNRIFIEAQQNYANHLLKSRGHVLLNDVYEQLGFDRTPDGAIVGWVYESETGDNFVDFGLFEAINSPRNTAADLYLDFNVDGVVYEKI